MADADLNIGYKRTDSMNVVKLIAKEDFHKIIEKEVGSRFREYRQKWDESGKCKLVQDFPLQLDIYLDFKCNLRCRSCIQWLPKDDPEKLAFGDPNPELPFKVFKSLVDEGVKHNLYSVEFDGINEPLIRPDFPDAIKYCREAGLVDVLFNTNGTLLTEEKAIEILDAEPTRIMFSLDAIKEETYKKLRAPGDLKKVMANINRFLELKKERGQRLPVTRVSFIVMKPNYAELPEFIDYWEDKVDFFSIQGFGNALVGTKYHDEIEEELAPPKETLKDRHERGFKCAIPFQRLPINSTGDALSCPTWYGFKQTVGNIYKNSVYEIWNGEKLQRIRDTVNGPWQEKTMMCKMCNMSLKAYPFLA